MWRDASCGCRWMMDEPRIIGDLCVVASVRSLHMPDSFARQPVIRAACFLYQDMGWRTTTCAQAQTKCFVCETRFLDSINSGTQVSWSTQGKVGERVLIVDSSPSLFLILVTSSMRTVARGQSWTSRRCARCCPRCQRCCHRHCFGCHSTNCHQEMPRKTCWHRRY